MASPVSSLSVSLPMPPWVEANLPPWMISVTFLGLGLWQWCGLVLFAAVAYLGGVIAQNIGLRIAQSVAQRTRTRWDEEFIALLPGPARYALSLLIFNLLLPLLHLSEAAQANVDLVVQSLLIAIVTWFASRFLTFGASFLEAHLTRVTPDEHTRRAVQTQIAVPRAILRVVIIVVGVALILLQFEVVQSIGFSLIGFAGLAGVAAVASAQRLLGNVFAGLQIAFFQPIKIGDTVIVEGEFGWIEDITLTYIVVKIWDLRRLVLPVSYFLERPFQNWTRGATDMLGTVYLYTDYTVPLEEVRAELERILKGTDLWDGKAQGVIVTKLTEKTAELRAMVSASDSGKLWNLRCLVREKFLEWLQSRGQDHLPTTRVLLERDQETAAT